MPAECNLRVDFHCHSNLSDGQLAPAALAAALAEAGVRHAALTDHNTVAGLAEFRHACESHGVRAISGLEICASLRGQYLHLLAYGFDPKNPALRLALRALENRRSIRAQAVIDRVHLLWRQITGKDRRANRRRNGASDAKGHISLRQLFAHLPHNEFTPARYLQASLAIDLVHRAGGCVFFAHPLPIFNRSGELEQAVRDLQVLGIDGLEIGCASDQDPDSARLIALADESKLLVSSGSDFHGPDDATATAPAPGVLMEPDHLEAFLAALSNARQAARVEGNPQNA